MTLSFKIKTKTIFPKTIVVWFVDILTNEIIVIPKNIKIFKINKNKNEETIIENSTQTQQIIGLNCLFNDIYEIKHNDTTIMLIN